MSELLLSVVVPAYNVSEYIGQCVHSIQNQQYRNLDIILVDDGSTDDTGILCDTIAASDARVCVIHQKNAGLFGAREAGLRAAAGELVTFVDGDDWIEPDMYAALLPQMQKADMLTSGFLRETENGATRGVYSLFEEGFYSDERYESLMRRIIYDSDRDVRLPFSASVCNKIFRTDKLHKTMKEVSAYLNCPITLDEDNLLLWSYMLRCNSVRLVKQAYYHYRYRADSSSAGNYERALIDINAVYLAMNHMLAKGDRFDVRKQLQRWFPMRVWEAMNTKMGLMDECIPIRFLLDTSELHEKRVALFGAGPCGRDYYRQLTAYGIPVARWVASRPKEALGCRVERYECLVGVDFDLVLIAVAKPDMAEEIRRQLVSLGVSEDKIFWKAPYTQF